MRKRLIAAATAAIMTASFGAGISAGAFNEWSYSEDLTVYVNGTKIDNGEYKPIIVNDRTLVRMVPVFEALGYSHTEMDANKTVSFVKDGSDAVYTFTAESDKAVVGTGEGSEYKLEVPATLKYFDVFYVPIRSFCEMAKLDISWDDATRSVYIKGDAAPMKVETLTYEEARALAEKYVNDSGISLDVDKTPVTYKGKQAYAFKLYSKSMAANGGSGFMGTAVYVYTDNSGIETSEVSGTPSTGTVSSGSLKYLGGAIRSFFGEYIGSAYCCAGYDVSEGKSILKMYGDKEMSLDEVAKFSKENPSPYTTVTGVTVQKALDMIKLAYGIEITGTAKVYEQCISTAFGNESYGVSYEPENDKYFVYSSSAEDLIDGDDSNISAFIFNSAGERVGEAN